MPATLLNNSFSETNSFIISTDKHLLQPVFIHPFISASYWAKGRTMEAIMNCIEHSLNFGVYVNGKQIGYARVVTDYTVFAYLMDLFIDEAYRGKGYSKQLVSYILEHPELKQVTTWRLATTDAHGLYEKFGFRPLSKPENMMERIVK